MRNCGRADVLIADPHFFDPLSAKGKATILALRARVELNRRDAKSALPFLNKALSLSGPLTSKVSLEDVAMRADAALIYQQLGDDENTKRYLAYTGAGHLSSNDWLSGVKELPVCGADLKPEDIAIVQFGIGSDGQTQGAMPVYASRRGEMGVIFADAVRNWRWEKAAIAKLDPFWRASIRLQLGCVTRPPADPLSKSFADEADGWLEAQGVGHAADMHFGAAVRDATQSATLRPLAEAMGNARKAGMTGIWAARAAEVDAVLVRMGAPVAVRVVAAAAIINPPQSTSVKGAAQTRADRLALLIPKVDGMPDAARAAAWLRTDRAIALETIGRLDEARSMLDAVEGLPTATLPAEDPIRRVATIHMSLIERLRGNPAAADARLRKTGITADQCDLFDVQPVPANVSVASTQFPTEALRWGFEGYVREAFDIAADGSVKQVRTVIAYPPFVFANATEKAVARFRYIPPTLNGEVLGCANQTQSIRFSIPR